MDLVKSLKNVLKKGMLGITVKFENPEPTSKMMKKVAWV